LKQGISPSLLTDDEIRDECQANGISSENFALSENIWQKYQAWQQQQQQNNQPSQSQNP